MLARAWPLFLTAILVILCVYFQASLLMHTEDKLRNWSVANNRLRVVLLVAYGLWQERGELDELKVWKKLGKDEAIKDPWQTPYRIKANPVSLQAMSAGPDGIWGDEDDLSVTLPRDLPQPEQGMDSSLSDMPIGEAKSSGRAAQ